MAPLEAALATALEKVQVCKTCGNIDTVNPCTVCTGSGRVTKERTLSVNIPAGVEDGTRIRLASEGEAGMRGGPSGDLYIFLSVKPHEFFQRDGADLFCKVPVSMTAAAMGGEIEVPTIDGKKARKASVEEVAEKTVKVLKATVPSAVPGIAFLSGIVWAGVRRYIQRPYRIRIPRALITGPLMTTP